MTSVELKSIIKTGKNGEVEFNRGRDGVLVRFRMDGIILGGGDCGATSKH